MTLAKVEVEGSARGPLLSRRPRSARLRRNLRKEAVRLVLASESEFSVGRRWSIGEEGVGVPEDQMGRG